MSWRQLAAMGLVLLAGCGAQQTQQPVAAVNEDVVELEYLLPEPNSAAGELAAQQIDFTAPVVDGFSDPNRIVYDQAYMERYVAKIADSPIVCGPPTFHMETSPGEIKCSGTREECPLGNRFRIDDLATFVQARITGKRSVQKFRVVNAMAAKIIREQPSAHIGKELRESPWDRDVQTASMLLALAHHTPVQQQFQAFLKEESPRLHATAVVGFGRLASTMPSAMEDLEKLLDDKELQVHAVNVLASLGPVAIPGLTRALDRPDKLLQNHLVHSSARRDPAVAVPLLTKALVNQDEEVRNWAARAVGDLISGGGSAAGEPYVEALADRLTNDANANTRYTAALAFYNMDTLAEPAKAALEQAAEKDADGHVREMAQKVLAKLPANP